MHQTAGKSKKKPLEIKAGSVTVKIYRTVNRGRAMFTLAYHDAGGRKLRQFADLAEAKREARTIADTLSAGRGAALELSGADRDSYLSAMRQLKPLDVPLHVAVSEYVKARGFNVPIVEAAKSYAESHDASLPDKTVAEVYQEMLKAKRADGASEAYLHDLKSRLGHFARDFKDSIANVQTSDLDNWLRTLKLSARSRNNHRRAVVGLFNFAKSRGYINRDRKSAAEHTARAKKSVEAIEVFSPAEMAKLLAAATVADKSLVPFFVLGGFCGLRTIEIKRLNWQDMLWPEKSIVISAAIAKTRTRRLAPLTDTAVAWLADWKNKTGRVATVEIIDQQVRKICKAAGVAWKHNGLRHSFITYRHSQTKDAVRTAYRDSYLSIASPTTPF
jgi:integrase